MKLLSVTPNEATGFFAVGQLARGVIAIGQSAVGVIAIGQLARGVIAIGQGAVGLIAIGQGALGIFEATAMLPIAGSIFFGRVPLLVPSIPRRLDIPKTSPLTSVGREAYVEADLVVSSDGASLFLPGGDSKNRLPVRFTPKLVNALSDFEQQVSRGAIHRKVYALVSRHPVGGFIARKIQTVPRLPWEKPYYWVIQVAKFAGLVAVAIAWWSLAGFEVLAILRT